MSSLQKTKLGFASDYMEGAHPAILEKLIETNYVKVPGYGTDNFCEAARQKIRTACNCPEAEIHFISGGTQANATVIDTLLRPWQGVIAADTGHVSGHEAGAIEHGGHKVLTLPHRNGKIRAEQVKQLLTLYRKDGNRDHLVEPGMVYISHPTEYGTLYSLAELTELSTTCRDAGIPLFLDGARLAYGLAAQGNDVSLTDLAALCDVFYIGGTKCGALLGEAVVFPVPNTIPHFFTMVKQHGALLAKGRVMGLQFDVLFNDGLYQTIGAGAVAAADRIREALTEYGYTMPIVNRTNQVFCVLENSEMEKLAEEVIFGFWETYDETHSVVRFATSWATAGEDVDALVCLLRDFRK